MVSSFFLENWVYSFENQEKLTPDSVSGRVENLQKIETSGLELYEQQCLNIFTFKPS